MPNVSQAGPRAAVLAASGLGVIGVPLVLGFHLVRTLVCNLLVGPTWTAMERLGLVR